MKIMENREITLADIFLDILSESQDKGAKLMAERIKAAIKSPGDIGAGKYMCYKCIGI